MKRFGKGATFLGVEGLDSEGRPGFLPSTVARDESGNYVPAIPLNLITGSGVGDGSNRLRVDSAQTSFFGKREYTLSSELNIPATNKQLFRFVATDDFIVEQLSLEVDGGAARLTTWSGGTPTGTFSALSPVAANSMSEGPVAPAPIMTVATTGPGATVALVGGTQIDVLRVVAANATAQASTVGFTQDSYRGRAAGTYYALIENVGSGAVTGGFRIRWEQRA